MSDTETESEDERLEAVVELNDNDVVLLSSNHKFHPGNVRFHKLIESYGDSSEVAKARIGLLIYNLVLQGNKGRFVKTSAKDQSFVQVGEKLARRMIRIELRASKTKEERAQQEKKKESDLDRFKKLEKMRRQKEQLDRINSKLAESGKEETKEDSSGTSDIELYQPRLDPVLEEPVIGKSSAPQKRATAASPLQQQQQPPPPPPQQVEVSNVDRAQAARLSIVARKKIESETNPRGPTSESTPNVVGQIVRLEDVPAALLASNQVFVTYINL
jgi:RNA recognition motif-containing protein